MGFVPSKSIGHQKQFHVGDEIEVWSKSLNTFCPGVVERLEGPMVHVKFKSPTGEFLTKAVPAGHPELKLVRSRATRQDNIGVTSTVRPQANVLVDTEEDIVEVGKHVKRKGALSMAAVHGTNPTNALSRNEHADGLNQEVTFVYQQHASPVANDIVHEAMFMAQYVNNKERHDCQDKDWPGPAGQDPLLTLYKTGERPAVAQALERLAGEVQRVLASQPTLVRVTVPCKVYGDIHGQFRDLLLLLHNYGFPSADQGPMFIFNGDWGDRGRHQLEVISLVFAMKALFPTRVWLMRGNHEDAVQNRSMGQAGLEAECAQKMGHYAPRVFDSIQNAFNWLPLGAILGDRILVVHGGIGHGNWDVGYLENLPAHVARPIDHDKIPTDKIVYNVLWSDPIPDDGDDRPEITGVHDSPRDGHAHMIVTFGRDITEAFCARNSLDMIIRSHQALAKGYGYDVMHGGKCVRVFSARDYEGSGNDGCVLDVEQGDGHLLVRPQVLRSLTCPKTDG
jgi:diadenosine tetraphosphatase ApaH/serine/threonine PP2A family protein phosphatase